MRRVSGLQMQSACDVSKVGPLGEMAIVDTFTKLIFGAVDGFSSSEEAIIQALRVVDSSVALDSRKDMGQYLRALGVPEMIRLVTLVHSCLGDEFEAVARVSNESSRDRPVGKSPIS